MTDKNPIFTTFSSRPLAEQKAMYERFHAENLQTISQIEARLERYTKLYHQLELTATGDLQRDFNEMRTPSMYRKLLTARANEVYANGFAQSLSYEQRWLEEIAIDVPVKEIPERPIGSGLQRLYSDIMIDTIEMKGMLEEVEKGGPLSRVGRSRDLKKKGKPKREDSFW